MDRRDIFEEVELNFDRDTTGHIEDVGYYEKVYLERLASVHRNALTDSSHAQLDKLQESQAFYRMNVLRQANTVYNLAPDSIVDMLTANTHKRQSKYRRVSEKLIDAFAASSLLGQRGSPDRQLVDEGIRDRISRIYAGHHDTYSRDVVSEDPVVQKIQELGDPDREAALYGVWQTVGDQLAQEFSMVAE